MPARPTSSSAGSSGRHGPPGCGRSSASASSSTSARPAGPGAVVAPRARGCLAGAELDLLGVEGGLPWLTIAYEPVWAIGTGRTARGSDAAAMADAIRAPLAALGMPNGGDDVPVLYGGSVTSGSIGEFLAEPAIDGALVGGASLKPDEMAGIVARAGLTAAARGATTPGRPLAG